MTRKSSKKATKSGDDRYRLKADGWPHPEIMAGAMLRVTRNANLIQSWTA